MTIEHGRSGYAVGLPAFGLEQSSLFSRSGIPNAAGPRCSFCDNAAATQRSGESDIFDACQPCAEAWDRDPEFLGDPGTADGVAARLSDEAILVAFGWFSFGSKASVTSNPPHANMKARQAALDELLAANLITHEHESEPRYRIDRHHFRGTQAVMDLFGTKRGKAVLAIAMETQRAETENTGSVAKP
jgi:hypothetical protein